MPENVFIYALCEPGTREIRYIGQTRHPNKRLREHLRDSCKKQSHLGHWLSKLLKEECPPFLIELACVPLSQRDTAEVLFIRLAKEQGMSLVNANDGGGGKDPSEETREKLRAHQLGEKGYWFGKVGPRIGTKQSSKTRAAISAAVSGEKNPMFGRPSPTKGVSRSEETKRAISLGLTGPRHPMFGKHHSEAHKAAVSAKLLGRPKSEETKARMRDSWARRHAPKAL